LRAKKEARRDGATPIELVSGEDLVKLFEDLELGLLPRKTYEIDRKFFDEFSRGT
jgi:restriction system protein